MDLRVMDWDMLAPLLVVSNQFDKKKLVGEEHFSPRMKNSRDIQFLLSEHAQVGLGFRSFEQPVQPQQPPLFLRNRETK